MRPSASYELNRPVDLDRDVKVVVEVVPVADPDLARKFGAWLQKLLNEAPTPGQGREP